MIDNATAKEITDGAIQLGIDIVRAAEDAVKQKTGSGIVTAAFDVVRPALEKVVPGAAILLPLVRNVILPMVEDKLTPAEYDSVIGSAMSFEEGLKEIVAAATVTRDDILKMSDAEIDKYARENGLYRNAG